MTAKILRGRILNFTAEPMGPEDTDCFDYIEDGALLVQNGCIESVGTFEAIKRDSVEIVDHRPNLLMAGFIDTHLHFPQVQIVASWGSQLLDWLNTYTFPAETKFVDEDHASEMAQRFYDQLTGHGTTTAAAFCSVHTQSVDAYFTEAERRNMRMIGGKVMMDRNAPDGLRDTPQTSYDDSKAMIEKWNGNGRAHCAITPRFAITSTPEQMEMAQALANEFPDCFIQTHLSENHDEIAFTQELYPDAPDYLGVYENYDLVRSNTFLSS